MSEPIDQKPGSPSAGDIYRKAAQLLESRKAHYQWSCWSICQAAGLHVYKEKDVPPELVQRYESWFKPAGSNHKWGVMWDGGGNPLLRNDCRILALCFMAAIADSEGSTAAKGEA